MGAGAIVIPKRRKRPAEVSLPIAEISRGALQEQPRTGDQACFARGKGGL